MSTTAERSAEQSIVRCNSLRRLGFKPHVIAFDERLVEWEFVSCPYPDGVSGVRIMVRKPGRPTTIREADVDDFCPVA